MVAPLRHVAGMIPVVSAPRRRAQSTVGPLLHVGQPLGEQRSCRHHQQPADVDVARRTAFPLPRHWAACPRRPFRTRGGCVRCHTWPAFRSACRPPWSPRPSARWPARSCGCPGSWRHWSAAHSHHYLRHLAGPRRWWRGSSPRPRPGSALVGTKGYLGAAIARLPEV